MFCDLWKFTWNRERMKKCYKFFTLHYDNRKIPECVIKNQFLFELTNKNCKNSTIETVCEKKSIFIKNIKKSIVKTNTSRKSYFVIIANACLTVPVQRKIFIKAKSALKTTPIIFFLFQRECFLFSCSSSSLLLCELQVKKKFRNYAIFWFNFRWCTKKSSFS